MDLRRFTKKSYQRIRSDGAKGAYITANRVFQKGLQIVNEFAPPGDPIYADDWDLLIVLDACRYDLMAEVVDNYEYLPSLDRRRSLNSLTRLWMEQNFTSEYTDEIGNTHYVSGNPFTKDKVDHRMFSSITEVWRQAWSDPGTVPPRAITDFTIQAARSSDDEQIIAHYMQPHCPFIPKQDICRTKDVEKFGNQPEGDVWDRLERGEVSNEEVWSGYRQNLELVLDDLALLLENVDAEKVVVTSDHGNAIGEYGVYGHPPNLPLDCLRVVPWIETSATDTGTYEPDLTEYESNIDREEQLKSLGYID